MKKIITIILTAAMLINILAISSTIANDFEHQDSNLEMVIENINDTIIRLSIEELTLSLKEIEENNRYYTEISLKGEGYTNQYGNAQLPVIRKIIEIPYGSTIDTTVDSIIWDYISLQNIGLPREIVPCQPSKEKIPNVDEEFTINDQYYQQDTYTHDEIVKIIDTGYLRGRHFALVELYPVQYIPLLGECKIINSCTITMDLQKSNMEKTYDNIQKYYFQILDIMIKTLSNYQKNPKAI